MTLIDTSIPKMSFFLRVFFFFWFLAISARAHAIETCHNPVVRKEWRNLKPTEQRSYISAVKCLMAKPALTSNSDLPGARSRFDDYVGTHILQKSAVHNTGIFYPWHRIFVAAYESELQACGYHGSAQPYWDWTLDADSEAAFFGSPIFHPDTGFGGNGYWMPENSSSSKSLSSSSSSDLFAGRTGGGCVMDGPFKDLIVNLGPDAGVEYNPRCLRRDFTPVQFLSRGSSVNVSEAMRIGDFGTFDFETESTIHGSGHLGVGGEYGLLKDVYASPGDPIFYLHHANMDRVWWSWQVQKPERRLEEISGPIVELDYDNEQGGNITLDTPIHVGSTVNVTVRVRDVMDIEAGYLCYTYDKLY